MTERRAQLRLPARDLDHAHQMRDRLGLFLLRDEHAALDSSIGRHSVLVTVPVHRLPELVREMHEDGFFD